MTQVALFIRHKTRQNCQKQVQEIWLKHMPTAILNHDGHGHYFYCSDATQPDVICAFQVYKDGKAAEDFLQTPAYLAYQREVVAFLEGPPELTSMSVLWEKVK